MKKQIKREIIFQSQHDMYQTILRWEKATSRIAEDMVGEHYVDECFARSTRYWLDPKAQRWSQEFYNGFYGFRRAYFTKVRRICIDMLRSPKCAGKTVRYLKVFNPNTGTLEMPKGFEGSDIEVDPETLPKSKMLHNIMEEIRESLESERDRHIFEMMSDGFKNGEIAKILGLKEKTIRNLTSGLRKDIRDRYEKGEYSFKLEDYTALDRQIGTTYYNSLYGNFSDEDILDEDNGTFS